LKEDAERNNRTDEPLEISSSSDIEISPEKIPADHKAEGIKDKVTTE